MSDAIAWPAGTTRRKMMVDLCGLADFLTPYFDNDGQLVFRPAPNLDTATPDHHYNEGPDCRIIADTIAETDDLWEASNVFLVVNTAATGVAIAGSYEVESSAPYSVTNRGFEVVKVIDAPGIESTTAAQERAAAAAAQETAAYRWVTFDATPDPRHDTFDIVEYRDENYREQAWTLVLAPGGPHRHELRRVYQP